MKRAFVLLLTGFFITSCSTGGKSVPADVKAPSTAKGSYVLPPFEEKTLANGLRVLFMPDDSLPYVSFSLLIRAGAAQDPAGGAGLASFVADLLDKGTSKRNATQIANALGQLGAEFDATVSDDYSFVSASAISTQAEALLNSFTEIVMEPAFSAPEVERLRKQVLAQIAKRVDNPGVFADVAFADFLLAPHPYSRPTNGTMKSISKIGRKDIIRHYVRFYRPNNSILAVVGKYSPELVEKIEKSFGAWEKREVPKVIAKEVPKISGVNVLIVDKPDLVQAQIRLGHLGISRKNEDFLSLRVANTILGGAFASRLNSRIRKDLGLTYGISSFFDAKMDVGPFEISSFTKNESAGQLVKETIQLLNDFKEKGVKKEEVDRAKGYLKGIFPTSIETREKLAFNLLLLRMYDIPDTYLTTYLNAIDSLGVAQLNRVIQKHFTPENIKVLVYSNAAQVAPQFEGMGKVEIKKASEIQSN